MTTEGIATIVAEQKTSLPEEYSFMIEDVIKEIDLIHDTHSYVNQCDQLISIYHNQCNLSSLYYRNTFTLGSYRSSCQLYCGVHSHFHTPDYCCLLY